MGSQRRLRPRQTAFWLASAAVARAVGSIACRNGNRAARRWSRAARLHALVFSLLSGFAIAMFVLPGAIALIAAAVMVRVRPARLAPGAAIRSWGRSPLALGERRLRADDERRDQPNG